MASKRRLRSATSEAFLHGAFIKPVMKIPANAPCTCGSGKKYKKCCKNITERPPERINLETPTMQLDVFGIRGMPQYITRQFTYGDGDPRNVIPPSGVKGKYQVVFTLSRPGFPLTAETRLVTAQQLRGDSHLGIAEPAVKFLSADTYDRIKMECNTVNGTFHFEGRPNTKGHLGQLICELFEAENFSDASLRAHHALAPALSNMSFFLDVPVNIYQIDVTETATQNVRMSFWSPHLEVALTVNPAYEASEELQKYCSLYREAMNSNSPNYQFLCFYKIIEGLRERRIQIRKGLVLAAKSKGIALPRFKDEKIPSEHEQQIEWLNSLFPLPREFDAMALDTIFSAEVVDRKVSNIIDKGQELHKLRNKIAHAVLDSGEMTFSIDNGLNIDEVYQWLPITKCLARYLISDGFPEIVSDQWL